MARPARPSLWPALLWAALGAAPSVVWSHGLEAEGLPLSPGWRVGAGLDAGYTQSNQSTQGAQSASVWPAARHAGVLLTGQTEPDRNRQLWLNQAVLAAGLRVQDWWGAELVASSHDQEAVHLDTARLEARTTWAAGELRARLGRQPVSLGPAIDSTASFDRFSLAPMAVQAAFNSSSWSNEGLALQWQQPIDDEAAWPQFQAIELGAWRGHSFPGAEQGKWAPSLRLGSAWGHASAQFFGAWLQPEGRGAAALSSATSGHSHGVPDCSQSLQNRVCFDGHTQLLGASLALDGVTLADWGLPGQAAFNLAGLLRRDHGTLYSTSASADYLGRSSGLWADAVWSAPSERWQVAMRLERLTPQNSLSGANAASLATASGLDGAAPVRRATLALGHSPFGNDAQAPRGALRLWLEAGAEQSRGASAQGWVGLRAQWLAPRWLGGQL